jgi:hypothetical protein
LRALRLPSWEYSTRSRARRATPRFAIGGELVAKGEVELGFFNLSEIPKAVTVAGALPGPLQGYTLYEAAVLSKGSTDQAATAFVKYILRARRLPRIGRRPSSSLPRLTCRPARADKVLRTRPPRGKMAGAIPI